MEIILPKTTKGEGPVMRGSLLSAMGPRQIFCSTGVTNGKIPLGWKRL